jgi:hypothetical protein
MIHQWYQTRRSQMGTKLTSASMKKDHRKVVNNVNKDSNNDALSFARSHSNAFGNAEPTYLKGSSIDEVKRRTK